VSGGVRLHVRSELAWTSRTEFHTSVTAFIVKMFVAAHPDYPGRLDPVAFLGESLECARANNAIGEGPPPQVDAESLGNGAASTLPWQLAPGRKWSGGANGERARSSDGKKRKLPPVVSPDTKAAVAHNIHSRGRENWGQSNQGAPHCQTFFALTPNLVRVATQGDTEKVAPASPLPTGSWRKTAAR